MLLRALVQPQKEELLWRVSKRRAVLACLQKKSCFNVSPNKTALVCLQTASFFG
jgi:hypothetical protein